MTNQTPDAPADATAAEHGESEHDIVLPWWQRPANIATMLVAMLLVAGMSGFLIGDARDTAAVTSSDADVGFLQDMIVHHEQAVDMSRIYLGRDDVHPGLRRIAESIQLGQSIEVGMMVQLLRDMDAPELGEEGQAMAWMGMPVPAEEMPGMATADELSELAGANGSDADRLFVELMIDHHEGGIAMMEAASAEARNRFVLGYAAAWHDSQSDEIGELERLLATL